LTTLSGVLGSELFNGSGFALGSSRFLGWELLSSSASETSGSEFLGWELLNGSALGTAGTDFTSVFWELLIGATVGTGSMPVVPKGSFNFKRPWEESFLPLRTPVLRTEAEPVLVCDARVPASVRARVVLYLHDNFAMRQKGGD